MNIQSLLNQLLQSANAGPGRTDLGKYATGAAAGGALALLLGSRRGLGGSAIKYGTVAALGALAWNAYREWEARQATPAAKPAAADPVLRERVDAELRRPVEPADVAAGVAGPEQAAEVYLASLVVCDTTTTMERAYLDALATALKLPPSLKADLEARAAAG